MMFPEAEQKTAAFLLVAKRSFFIQNTFRTAFRCYEFLFSFLFGAGIVSVASMAVSSAESRIPEVPSAPALRPVSGSIKAGYSTNYEFRGLIPAGCNPTAPLRLDWRSDLNDRYSLILALKEEIFLGHPAVDIENETMVDLGLQRKFGKATYAALSFRANDGGLAGFASERLFGNGGTTYERH